MKDKTRDTLLIVTLTLLIRLLKGDDPTTKYAIAEAEEVAQQAINEMISRYGATL